MYIVKLLLQINVISNVNFYCTSRADPFLLTFGVKIKKYASMFISSIT